MPKKPSTSRKTDSRSTANGKQKVTWKGYVNFSLTDQDKERANEYFTKPGWTEEKVEELADDGFKLSFSFDSYNSCYVASLYCQDAKRAEAGYCLTARATNFVAAVFRVVYIHFVCLEESWSTESDRSWRDDQW